MKLALGTVQFGTPYGISNQMGQTPLREVEAILDYAAEAGIGLLDTASLYGESEAVIGKVLAKDHPFRIVTKSPQFADLSIPAEAAKLLERTFIHSLQKLKQERTYGLLFHRAADLLAPEGDYLFQEALRLKEHGLVEKVGVSVYSGEQIDQILQRFAIDLIQLPVSLLDQRLLQSGHLAALHNRGVEIHARSVFLQGLLLMPPAEINPYFSPISPTLTAYHSAMEELQAPLQAGALAFVKQIAQVDQIIIGVNSRRHLEENVHAYQHTLPDNLEFAAFACNDPSMLSPGQWKLQ